MGHGAPAAWRWRNENQTWRVEDRAKFAKERIKRLEEAGNMMKNDLINHYRETGSINAWNAATESTQ